MFRCKSGAGEVLMPEANAEASRDKVELGLFPEVEPLSISIQAYCFAPLKTALDLA